VLSYTGEGFVPAIIEPKPINDISAITFLGAQVAAKYPVVKSWQVAAPNSVDEQKLIIDKGPYVPWRNLALANAYPVVEGYKSATGIGYHANIDDPLQFMNIGITAIATYIGAGGLGAFISRGISQTDSRQLITGALAVSLLAIAADYLLLWAQHRLTPVGIRTSRTPKHRSVVAAASAAASA